MTALRVIAIDDEPLALRRLEWCLQELPDVALVGKTGDPQRGLELIRTLAPDVVLLDVEMPELSGFELIDALGELGDGSLPEIVFVTAFDHFAVKAFAASVVDYLLKPVERSRLMEALQRARVRRELRNAEARVQEFARSSTTCVPTGAAADREVGTPDRAVDRRRRCAGTRADRDDRAPGSRRRLRRLHVGQRARLMRARLGDRGTARPRSNSCGYIARDRASRSDRGDPPPRIRAHVRSAVRRSGSSLLVVAHVSRVAHALRFRKERA